MKRRGRRPCDCRSFSTQSCRLRLKNRSRKRHVRRLSELLPRRRSEKRHPVSRPIGLLLRRPSEKPWKRPRAYSSRLSLSRRPLVLKPNALLLKRSHVKRRNVLRPKRQPKKRPSVSLLRRKRVGRLKARLLKRLSDFKPPC